MRARVLALLKPANVAGRIAKRRHNPVNRRLLHPRRRRIRHDPGDQLGPRECQRDADIAWVVPIRVLNPLLNGSPFHTGPTAQAPPVVSVLGGSFAIAIATYHKRACAIGFHQNGGSSSSGPSLGGMTSTLSESTICPLKFTLPA